MQVDHLLGLLLLIEPLLESNDALSNQPIAGASALPGNKGDLGSTPKNKKRCFLIVVVVMMAIAINVAITLVIRNT